MSTSTRPRWVFEPQWGFATKESRRVYQSFIWSAWLFLVLVPPFLIAPLLAGFTGPFLNSAEATLLTVPGLVLASVITWRWLKNGFDLRDVRPRFEAGLLFVWPVVTAIISLVSQDTHLRIVSGSLSVAFLITALISLTFTGTFNSALAVTVISAGHAYVLLDTTVSFILGVALWTFASWVTLRMSIWYVDVVGDLERARKTEAELAVAEERLRFSADLHDVMGRNLSAISLKAQLADQLIGRDEAQARTQLAEVRELASSSLQDVRGLVRGYRAPDLTHELSGAVSLLKASGSKVSVAGSPEDLTEQQAHHAAACIREGATNILRHAHAEHVSITFSPTALKIVNDGALHEESIGTGGGGTGLAGLAQRIGSGGTLRHRGEGDTFILELVFKEHP